MDFNLPKLGFHRTGQMYKRQWGTEKHTKPLSIVHPKPSTAKLAFGRVAIVLTVVFWAMYISSIIIRQLVEGPQSYSFTKEAFGYAFVVTLLTFSCLVYLITRQGALERFKRHTRTPRAILYEYFAQKQPTLTILIPSYSEEYQVIRKTILSAALQEYPNLRIVLLLDDNPYPSKQSDSKRLTAIRNLDHDLQAWMKEPRDRFGQALKKYEAAIKRTEHASVQAVTILADHYQWASNWLHQKADEENIDDHIDQFLADQVLRQLGKELNLMATALNESVAEQLEVSSSQVHQLYQRLVWIFQVDFEIFERKKFKSLSHAANKAMNLNSYIGLMGGTYLQQKTPDGIGLKPTTTQGSDSLTIPNSDYILTLDADSILLREYCLRLIYILEQPESERIAIIQTPYSSFRGARTRIERLASATTDIQHILHQGMSKYQATFWVGANAIIRKRALEDIVEKERNGEFEIKRYIQDRTVIEDTESSVDLVGHGWQLVNYPERLSYSATPPDFGSLVVQRRRWANGGLLILPKWFFQIRQRKNRNEIIHITEAILRVNYMASISWATFGLMFLLVYPYDGRLLSPLVILAALPYFIIMASDLKYCGYKYSDIFRIYGLNLMLLPVNLAGVLKSLQQAIMDVKIPFARTPKVKNRTPAPLVYVLGPLFIAAFSVFTIWRNVEIQNWGNALFAGFNTVAVSWSIVAYIGPYNILSDIWLRIFNWFYVEDVPEKSISNTHADFSMDWKRILWHGEIKKGASYQQGADRRRL